MIGIERVMTVQEGDWLEGRVCSALEFLHALNANIHNMCMHYTHFCGGGRGGAGIGINKLCLNP